MRSGRLVVKRVARRTAFTLVEVLIVLAILGVIAAMVAPQILGRQDQANRDAARLSIKGLEQALEMYALDHTGEYPPTATGLEVLVIAQQNDPNWKGPYLKNSTDLPKDPWGTPIQYQYPGQNQGNQDKPDLWSMGRDRTSGTADDINNWGPKT
jgi:general secretion pathway protein G